MGKCKLSDVWFEKDDGQGFKVKEWAKRLDNDVFCVVCSATISISLKGFQGLTQHASTFKHKQQCKDKLNLKQLRLTSVSSQQISTTTTNPDTLNSSLHLYNISDRAVVAEIVWTLKCVASNYSFASCNDIVDVFKTMFPDSLPKGFSLSREKLRYLITDALGPFFKSQLIKDLNGVYYSLIYDETTNSKGKKELRVLIRYYSKEKGKIVSQHLETFFIGKATAIILFEKLVLALDNSHLPLSNILMLGSDGPNVNKAVYRKMNEQLLLCREKSLIDIGTCNIHIVHNAYLKGLSKFGEDASDLILLIYHYFDGYPSRWEEFVSILNDLELPTKHFIKHVTSRWLTLQNAAERLLQNWKGIEKYFLTFIPKEKQAILSTRSYQKIRSLLIIPTIKCEVLFVCSSAKVFTKFTGHMQKEEPLVHIMFSELCDLIKTLLGKICKLNEIPKSFSDINIDDIFTQEKLLPVKNIYVNDEIQKELKEKKMSEKDNLLFLKNIQGHYIAASKHILNVSSLTKPILKNLRCLHPAERCSNRSCNDILKLARQLPINIDTDLLLDEWRLLQLEKDTKGSADYRIDLYWQQYFDKKSIAKEEKYPNVVKVIKAALSLIHGSADVERSFSSSGRMLTEDRAAMSERTLNSLLTIKDTLMHYNNKPHLILITKELITMARGAYRHYQDYLNELEEIKMQNEKFKAEKKLKKIAEAKIQKELSNEQKLIEINENNLKQKREEESLKRGAANKLFHEANKRLKIALENKNLEEAELAHAMLEGVNKVRKEEEIKKKQADAIQKEIEKKKSSLLSNFEKIKNN